MFPFYLGENKQQMIRLRFFCVREREMITTLSNIHVFLLQNQEEKIQILALFVCARERGLVMAVARSNLVACQIMW